MRTKHYPCRNFLSAAALVVSLASPVVGRAYDATRAAAASDPENAASYASGDSPARPWTKATPEGAAVRAAAASDPENAASYASGDSPARPQLTRAASHGSRSAMVSDPENVAAHTAG